MVTGRVVWVEPIFQCTSDPPVGSEVGRKFVPARVSVNAGLPAAALFGEIEVRVGTGLGGALMMKERVFESPLFPAPDAGLNVFTNAVPGLATKAAGTVAVIPMISPALSMVSVEAIVF